MIEQATAGAVAEPPPPAGSAVLDGLRELSGLVHACVVDAEGGRVLDEVGVDGGAAALLVGWARRAGRVSGERGRALEDVIVTTASAHHLVRPVVSAGRETLWVAVRVDRERGNLALARRHLAHAARSSEQRPVPPRPTPSPVPRLPAPRLPAPQLPAPRVPSEPRTVRPTALVEPVTVPPPPTGPTGPAGPTGPTGPTDLFAPVTPSPGPAPSAVAAVAGPTEPAPPVPSVDHLAAEPDVDRGPGEPRPEDHDGLPRRRPGAATLPAPGTTPQVRTTGAHRERAAPTSRWRRDEGTLRRLLVGLRRLA